MHIVAVDLAAKYSAACWMRADGSIVAQWDSWQCSQDEFVANTCVPFAPTGSDAPGRIPRLLAIEDLPHGVKYMMNTKAVLRLQGRFGDRMSTYGFRDRILFVDPRYWRSGFDNMGRGTGPEAVLPAAASLGYHAPDLAYRCTERGSRAISRKVQTDYCAAFLIATWLYRQYQQHKTFDVPGTSRYPDV